MPTEFDDAIASARGRLGASLRVMTGASGSLIPVVGEVFGRGLADEDVMREMANASARMALDETGFYDAGAVVVGDTLATITSTLRALNQLTDGPNSLLEWCRDSRSPKQDVASLEDLLRSIQLARFARSEVTETVRTDLISKAKLAADELAARLRADGVAELPTYTQLQVLVALVDETILSANKLIGLRATFEAQRFEELALFRVLEAAEGELGSLFQAVAGDIRDLGAEAGATAVATALESALSALTYRPPAFGNLLVMEATVSPLDVNVSAEITLSPIPELARGGLVLPGTLAEHPTDVGSRLLTFIPEGDWADSSEVEQVVSLAYDEQVYLLGHATPVSPVTDSGEGTIAGEPNYVDLVDAVVFTAEVGIHVSSAALPPAGSYPDKLAYVAIGATTDLWYSDGTSWELVETGVDPRGGRFLQASGYPLGSRAAPGDTVLIEKVSGSGGAYSGTALVVNSGRSAASSSVDDVLGVTLDAFVTNSTDWVVRWSVLDAGLTSTGETNRVMFTGGWAQTVPPLELVGRIATLWVVGSGWTHRVIDQVVDVAGGFEMVFTKPIPSADTYVHLPKLPDFPFPGSHYVKVQSEFPDMRPGDVVAVDVNGTLETRGVLHAVGDQAVLHAPLLTHPGFAAEAEGFSPETSPTTLPQDDPYVYATGRRFRHMAIGDRIVALPTLPSTPGAGVEPVDGEAYVITGFRADGVEVAPQSNESPGALPRSYRRLVILPQGSSVTTDLFLATDELGNDAALADLERTARREKMADYPETDLDDTWPLREVTFMMNGRPVDASRAWSNILRFSERVPIWTMPFTSELRARLSTDGRRADLEVVDDSFREDTIALSLTPARLPLGASALADFATGLQYRVRGGTLETVETVTSVLLQEEASGARRGPVYFGGPVEFAFWEWAMQRIRRISRPNLGELEEDLGRALADLGEAKTRTYPCTYTSVSDPDTFTVVVSFTTPPPTAAILLGTDFDDGVAAALPIRVVSVVDGTTPSPATVTMTLTRLPTVAPGGVVNFRGTIVGQAWREVRAVVQYLDELHDVLSQVRAPKVRTVASTAARLEAKGYLAAAEAVRTADFAKWSDIVGLSVRGELADRTEALVSSILSRRRSPLEA